MSASPYPYPKFMLKEIAEQPDAIRRTIEAHLSGQALAPVFDALRMATKLVIAASGSSRHAGLAGEIMIEDLSDIACDVEYSSEYSYRRPRVSTHYVIMVITQSGETADTLAALREATSRGARTIAIANVEHSTIVREATAEYLTYAGVEVAIPATKSFTAQLAALHSFALRLATIRKSLPAEEIARRLALLTEVPRAIEGSLAAWEEQAKAAALANFGAKQFIFLGRGIHYAIAREGALKLKEISYAHAEAYPAGELRHGPQALIDSSLPVVLIATRDRNDDGSVLRYEKTLAIAREIKERKGRLIVVANEGDEEIASIADHVMSVPEASEHLLPLLEVVPLQYFAYHIAHLNGLDVDKPRSLVKAVLTE
ncbi:MAG: SIS domain-containing protein [Acidobacteriaceae bacterium]